MDTDKTRIGWIKLHRKIKDWKYCGKLKYEKLWQILLFEANYAGQHLEGEYINRGELVFSYNSYMEKLKGCSPKITKQNLQTMIKNLKADKQIILRYPSGKKFTIIKIINYEKYQTLPDIEYERKLDQQALEIEELRSRLSALNAEKTNTVTHTVNNTVTHTVNRTCQDKNQDSNDVSKVIETKKNDSEQENKTNTVTGKTNTETNTVTHIVNNIETNTTKRNKEIKKIKNKEPKEIYTPAKEIIDYLNLKAGKKFLATTKATIRLIKARQNEGFVLEDFKQVIDSKCIDWIGNIAKDGRSMEEYLRPETLFGSKFEGYLNKSSSLKKQDIDKEESDRRMAEYIRLEKEEEARINKSIKEMDKQLEESKRKENNEENILGFQEWQEGTVHDGVPF